MGADGGITIYDWEKMEKKFDKETLDSFLGHCSDSTTYVHELNGKRYFTLYRGDNLDVYGAFDTLLHAYDLQKDSFDSKSSFYDQCAAEYLNKLHQEHRKSLKAIVDYLITECQITYWEVWT